MVIKRIRIDDFENIPHFESSFDSRLAVLPLGIEYTVLKAIGIILKSDLLAGNKIYASEKTLIQAEISAWCNGNTLMKEEEKMKHRVSKQILSILLCFVILLGMLPITALAAETIESANATITEPVVGANPDFNIVSADESKYTVTVVKWNLLDGSSYPVLTAGDKFVRGESYQLDVKFVANPGYEFSDSCVYNVNGVSRAAYSLTKGERRCYFDVYEIIDTINVKGVVAPVAGATPDVSGITSDTDGINVIDVKWRDKDGYAFERDPFVAGEKYILWLKYETESGYKVADDAEVTFNISDSNILDKKITPPIIKMTYEVPAASIPTTYTVSFAANGGTSTMADVTGVSGEYELPACTFTAPSGKQFKAWSVAILQNVVAANYGISKTDLERLRGICVNEVKKINGSITFDEAIGWQS